MPPSFIPKELPPFNANTSIGAFEIGTLLATTLFGATCIQVYIYFERYAKDHKLIKALVVFVWLLELGHTIAICHALYIMTVSWFTQPENLVILPVSVDASVLLSGLIGPLEQAWFIHRLYTFSKNKVLTGVCCILSFLRIFGSVALSGVSLQRLMLLEFDQKYWWLLMSIVIVGTLNDGLLAGSLAWYLNKSKNQTVARATNSVLNHLIMWVVETSAITSVATVSMMICFFTMPANLVYIGAYVCLAKLYANALLASLNARKSFGHRFSEIIRLRDLSSGSTARTLPQLLASGYPSQTSGEIVGMELSSSEASGKYHFNRTANASSEFPVTEVRMEKHIISTTAI